MPRSAQRKDYRSVRRQLAYVLAVCVQLLVAVRCSGRQSDNAHARMKATHDISTIPTTVQIEWTTTDIRPAAQRAELVKTLSRKWPKVYAGTVVLKKTHRFVKSADNVRYEFRGDIPSSIMALGHCATHTIWVYNPDTRRTRMLDSANDLRKNPQGSITRGMTISDMTEPSLGPLLQWLGVQENPTNAPTHKLPRPGPLVYHEETAEWVSEWISPTGVPLSKVKGSSNPHVISRMKYERMDSLDVPKSWVYESGVGGKPISVVTAIVTAIDFPTEVDHSLYELPFPPGTVFDDRSEKPATFCVVDSTGVEHVTTDENAFFRHSYEELISPNSTIPRRLSISDRGILPLLGGLMLIGFIVVAGIAIRRLLIKSTC